MCDVSAAAVGLSEAVAEGQKKTHGQDPGADLLGLLRLSGVLLLEEALQQRPAWTRRQTQVSIANEHDAVIIRDAHELKLISGD